MTRCRGIHEHGRKSTPSTKYSRLPRLLCGGHGSGAGRLRADLVALALADADGGRDKLHGFLSVGRRSLEAIQLD